MGTFKGEIAFGTLNSKFKTGFNVGDIYRVQGAGNLVPNNLPVANGAFVEWKGTAWEVKNDMQYATSKTGESLDQVVAAVAAVEAQIDEIAEKAGSGYTPKGESTVATLNALSGQENGELYTMTDAGTLTDGSLAVVAGDTVAWDATNEVWYKAMDYVPRQYGTNEVHNLPTTITAFRTDDVIPVDGPSGTAKMSTDDLLAVTAQNALGSIHSLSNTATEADLVAGNYLAMDGNNGTKKVPSDLFAKSSEVGKNISVAGTLATTYDYNIVRVRGKIGDVVSLDYTASQNSSLVVVPEGGSASALTNQAKSGHYDYVLTSLSADFGIFGAVGVDYTLSAKSGLKLDIDAVANNFSNFKKSNIKTIYSGTLASAYDYKIAYVEGNIGDKVLINYTTSASSNLVVIPQGGSATILKNGGTGGIVEYTMTASSATFGVFGNVGMTYSITIEAGLSYQIKTTRHNLGNVDVYTGTISYYNYNIAKIEGNIGEKVLIKFETSASAGFVIGHTAVRTGTFGWYEYTLTSTSIGVGFYVTEETNYTLEIRRGVTGNVASLMESTSVLKTKNLLVLGDSISTSPYYYKYLMKEFSACRNIAVVSATWADRNNTDAYDGNPTQGVAKGNVMGNQVQKIKNTPSLVSFAPDVILLAAGTNDSDSTGATLNESLFTDSNGFVSLGTPTFDSADTYMANRRTMAGAMRYCITELEKIYPNAQIFICTPIQSSQSIHQYVNTKNKQELQKAVGQRMSVNIIDVGGGCGIYGDFEWQGSEWTEQEPDSHAGRDLYDGLHPNNSGSQKMAKYIYNEILRILKK